MNYYLLMPEYAGDIGYGTKIAYYFEKKKNEKDMEYEFQGWMGDELLMAYPHYVVSEELQKDIVEAKLKGAVFKGIKVSFTENFYEYFDESEVLPKFSRIVIRHHIKGDEDTLKYDFYLGEHEEMIVSERAYEIIKKHKICFCVVEKYPPEDEDMAY